MTPEQIRALDTDARAQLLERLAVKHYGDGWHDPLARDFEVHRATVFRWCQRREVPLPVLFALAAWVDDGAQGRAEIASMAQLMADQIKALQRLSRAASRPATRASS